MIPPSPPSFSAATTRLYPEIEAGGFSRVDGTIAFYERVNALLSPTMTVMDFGAGRGANALDDPVPHRRALQTLRGRVKEVVGVDIDPAVLDNPAVDRAVVTDASAPLPLGDQSVDLIVSDFCFEHVQDPALVASELDRVLRTGGWLCARTPNRWGYISMAARLVPNRWHVPALTALQPSRKAVDVFPTYYRLNTRATLRKHFPPHRFTHCTFGHNGPPAYFGRRSSALRVAHTVLRHTPERFSPLLFVFIRKDVGR